MESQKIEKKLSDKHTLFGFAEWGSDTLFITWEGEHWGGYPGAVGSVMFDSTYGRTERLPLNEGGKSVTLPDGYIFV